MLKVGRSSRCSMIFNTTIFPKFLSCKVCLQHKFLLNWSFSHEECHLLMNRIACIWDLVHICNPSKRKKKFSKNCCTFSSQMDDFHTSSYKCGCQILKPRKCNCVSTQGTSNNLKILTHLLTCIVKGVWCCDGNKVELLLKSFWDRWWSRACRWCDNIKKQVVQWWGAEGVQ